MPLQYYKVKMNKYKYLSPNQTITKSMLQFNESIPAQPTHMSNDTKIQNNFTGYIPKRPTSPQLLQSKKQTNVQKSIQNKKRDCFYDASTNNISNYTYLEYQMKGNTDLYQYQSKQYQKHYVDVMLDDIVRKLPTSPSRRINRTGKNIFTTDVFQTEQQINQFKQYKTQHCRIRQNGLHCLQNTIVRDIPQDKISCQLQVQTTQLNPK